LSLISCLADPLFLVGVSDNAYQPGSGQDFSQHFFETEGLTANRASLLNGRVSEMLERRPLLRVLFLKLDWLNQSSSQVSESVPNPVAS